MDEKTKEEVNPVTTPQDVTSGDKATLTTGELETLHVDGIDPIFEAQAQLINHAVQVIGMGKYQWALFGLCGYGWLVDQLWQTAVADALAQASLEFNVSHSAFLSLALVAGLVSGATFWGIGCDLIGRRLAFNLTLLIGAVFGLASGAAPNFPALAVLLALVGTGVGGNLPVDSAVFLEFLPGTHQYLLEILAVWWSLGSIIPAGAAWGFLSKYSCPSDTPAGHCTRAENMGWRYLLFTMGAVTLTAFLARFLLFHLHESPKYLIGKGRYQEAVDTLNAVAKYNGTTQPVTVEDLLRIEREFASPTDGREAVVRKTALQRILANFTREGGWKHVKALFSSRKQAFSMIMITLIWGMVGLGSPLYSNFLPQYLALHGAESGSNSINVTYRNNLIVVACSIPGTMLSGWLITLPIIGRRGTLGLAFIVSGAFLFAFTSARTQESILAFNCVANMVQFIMWGALYCYTPEVIPSLHRGTGTGIAAAFNRLCGLQAPIIATYVGYTNTPIFVSASLFVAAGLLSFFLPYETRGKVSL